MGLQVVLADIHANEVALKALESSLRAQFGPISAYWCLGDVIGYGPNPVEVWEWARRRCAERWALGNHDAWLIEGEEQTINSVAKQCLEYHRRLLQEEGVLDEMIEAIQDLFKRQIAVEIDEGKLDKGLPSWEQEGTLWLFAHGSPFPAGERHIRYLYPWSDLFLRAIAERLERFRRKKGLTRVVLFVGHTHYPMVLRLADGGMRFDSIRYDTWFSLEPSPVWIINPGSVGQPRDGDPRAAYAMFDPIAQKVWLGRSPYSLERLAARYHNNGFSEALAEKLLNRILNPRGEDKFERYQQYYQRPEWDLKAVADRLM